ncbi:MAG: nucleotide sugar dehydrogenase [Dehalococcoidia bacterium]|nr:nucleotide sugar dehydrogenase [Dehalococcoidia bacterium]
MRVAVVGLGKIGLPLAAQYAVKGASVIGCDINPEVAGAVNAGACPIGGEPGLPEAVAQAHAAGRLRATTDTPAAAAESNVVVVIVRVGIDEANHTDLSNLDAATKAIARGLRPDTLVILESTVPVGVTRSHFGRRLAEGSGLSLTDFRLAYSPERVSSGTMFRDLATYPKVVGGIDAASGEAARAFYEQVLDAEVLLVADAETAEFAKLAESIYRDVNIALANELAIAAEALGVSYKAAAAASNSQPYSHLHAPGLGVGGHCIPVYPYFLIEASGQPIVSLSRQINDSMAAYAVDKLAAAFDGNLAGRRVLILGLAYRGGVKEATLSSALLVADALRQRGARPLIHDPLFTATEIESYGLEAADLPPSEPVDAVILQALHPEYKDLDLSALKGCRVFLDGRGAMDHARVQAAGMRYIGIGVG